MKAVAYLGMLVFDFAMIAGTVYLIDQREWSKWTMVLTLLLIGGSTPKFFIK